MKNIILAGLQFDTNLGDQAIYISTYHMIKDILKENNMEDIELRGLDLYGRVLENRYVCKKNLVEKIFYKILEYYNKKEEIYDSQRKWMEKNIRKICKKKIDRNTIAIIFFGGGLIKFSYQSFEIQIKEIINVSENKCIPVMFSAVGIEGYNESKACQEIKKALHSSCVKCITTRDDFRLLEQYYCPSKNVIKARVADPACSLAQVYLRKKKKEGRIGINVVREGLFLDNEISFHKEEMLSLWGEIYRKIEKRGYKVQIFSNGLKQDQKFGEELVEYLNVANKDNILCDRPKNLEELLDILMQFNGVFAVRLHASILSYAFEIPAVGLVWNQKQIMFANITKQSERFFKIGSNSDVMVETLLKNVTKNQEKRDQEYCDSTKIYLQRFIKDYIVDLYEEEKV